jgi:4'-phosphopantetheinyl transferase
MQRMQPTVDSQFWLPGPSALVSEAEFIHVWRIALNPPAPLLTRLERWLSPDERERAQRFRFDHHREQFITAHACLRDILGRYLSMTPEVLRFDVSAYGKPGLTNEFGGGKLTFNLSHSYELGLVAVADRRAIGVDIEYIRADLADEQVARRFFSNLEVEALLSLPKELRKEAFFTCWTRKEAFIKALGEGLSAPLDQFDVSLLPGGPAELLETRPDPAQALQWKLYALAPGSGYTGALAVEGQPGPINCWQWTEKTPEWAW